MKCQRLSQLPDIRGKTVLLRLDLNVPQSAPGVVGHEDDWKIQKSLPTIEHILSRGASIIILTHWGRPKGRAVPQYSVEPIARFVGRLIKKNINVLPLAILKNKTAPHMQEGHVAMLENVRFNTGEDKNDARFARSLAALGSVYVNDAFAVCHRVAASVVGITKHLPSFAGDQLYLEVSVLEQVRERPRQPFEVIMGGLKFETKIPVIRRLLPRARHIMLSGGLSSTILASLGYGVGASEIDHAYFKQARALMKDKKIMLPADVIIGHKHNRGDYHHARIPIAPATLCSSAYAIYDIGPETVRRYSQFIKKAETIVWNGPLGLFEDRPYDQGTLAIARVVAARSKGHAFGVVGGGETVVALKRTHTLHWVDHVSTGGGAMLEYLGGADLPGISALEQKRV
ncbi:MAG: phosphoglycerate kinase [Candidatus Magasanikbacteria bacterium]|nr:phosphoglycerate kinase [Candidatus Magasanikbacteria bacterium]